MWLKKWLFEHAPISSGTLNIRRLPWGSAVGAYQKYKADIRSHTNFIIRSMPTFVKWMKYFKIKLAKFDRYLCRICHVGRHIQLKRERGNHLSLNERRLLTKYISHCEVVEKQRESYKKQINTLDNNSAVVLFDYTTIHEATSFKLKVLNCTVVYRSEGSKCFYFDYMAEAHADFRFTIRSWVDLIDRIRKLVPNLKKIETWSDGGLKTKEIVDYLLRLGKEENIELNINYFAPYHGHNLCDGHFGGCKIQLRKITGSGIVSGPEEVERVFSKRKNTKVFRWTREHLEDLPLPRMVPFSQGIRKFFHFSLMNVQMSNNILTLSCKPLSSSLSSDCIVQTITTK